MQKLKNIVKNNKLISLMYMSIMYILYFILDHSLRKQKKMIFASFSGRQYSDSPKVLYEYLKTDARFKNYEFVWAFNEPDKFQMIPQEDKVNINSFKFLLELFSSSIWISNASIEKLIPYKSRKIFYLNTWHGIPLKKIGKDEENASPLIKKWYNNVQFDLLTTCSEYDEDIFKMVFPSATKYLRSGLPRNIELEVSKEQEQAIKAKFYKKHKLTGNERFVLYAPTFREFKSNKVNSILTGKTLPKTDSATILLLRTHYFEKVDIQATNIINVSEEELNELMIISDVLISDYSSLMFDYYLLDKPIYMYGYDYEEYKSIRGFYLDLRETYGIHILNEEEVAQIYQSDVELYQINSSLSKANFVKSVDLEKIIHSIVNFIYEKG